MEVKTVEISTSSFDCINDIFRYPFPFLTNTVSKGFFERKIER